MSATTSSRAVLVDENFPALAAAALAAVGHDVQSVSTKAPGLDDLGVLQMARDSDRWLLTFDADFGELVYRRGAAPPPAILYFRLHPLVITELIACALRALTYTPAGHFAVVTAGSTRLRLLPAATNPAG